MAPMCMALRRLSWLASWASCGTDEDEPHPCDGEVDERLGREQLRIADAHRPSARLSCFQEIEQDLWKVVAMLPNGDAIVVEALDPLLADIRTLVAPPYPITDASTLIPVTPPLTGASIFLLVVLPPVVSLHIARQLSRVPWRSLG